jgi:hypothetical protein
MISASVCVLAFNLIGCGGSTTKSSEITTNNIQLNIRMEWQVYDEYDEKSLLLNVEVIENDGTRIRYIEVENKGELILSFNDTQDDLYDDYSLTGGVLFPASTAGYSKRIALHTFSDNKLKIEAFLNNEKYVADVDIPELLQVTVNTEIFKSYNPNYDNLDIDWLSGIPVSEISIRQTHWISSTDQSCSAEYYKHQPDEYEVSHTIVAGIFEYTCDPEDRTHLSIRQSDTAINPHFVNFKEVNVSLSSDYRRPIVTDL